MKERKASAEPETFATRPETHANKKTKPKHAVLDATQGPFEHMLVLRLVVFFYWVSFRTRLDISWAVASITRLATSDEHKLAFAFGMSSNTCDGQYSLLLYGCKLVA